MMNPSNLSPSVSSQEREVGSAWLWGRGSARGCHDTQDQEKRDDQKQQGLESKWWGASAGGLCPLLVFMWLLFLNRGIWTLKMINYLYCWWHARRMDIFSIYIFLSLSLWDFEVLVFCSRFGVMLFFRNGLSSDILFSGFSIIILLGSRLIFG